MLLQYSQRESQSPTVAYYSARACVLVRKYIIKHCCATDCHTACGGFVSGPARSCAGYREASATARDQLEAVSFDHKADEAAFRQDLLNIARTTLSSKILTQVRGSRGRHRKPPNVQMPIAHFLECCAIFQVAGYSLLVYQHLHVAPPSYPLHQHAI